MQPLYPHLPVDHSQPLSTQVGSQPQRGASHMDLNTESKAMTQRMIENGNQGNINTSSADQGTNSVHTFTGEGVFSDVRINAGAPVISGSGASLPSLPVLGGLAEGTPNPSIPQGQMMHLNVNGLNTSARPPYSSLNPNVNVNINMNADANLPSLSALQMQMAFRGGGVRSVNTAMNGNGGTATLIHQPTSTYPQCVGSIFPGRGLNNIMNVDPTAVSNANASIQMPPNLQGATMERTIKPNLQANHQAATTLYWNTMQGQQSIITNPHASDTVNANPLMQMLRQPQQKLQQKVQQSSSNIIGQMRSAQPLRAINIPAMVQSSASAKNNTNHVIAQPQSYVPSKPQIVIGVTPHLSRSSVSTEEQLHEKASIGTASVHKFQERDSAQDDKDNPSLFVSRKPGEKKEIGVCRSAVPVHWNSCMRQPPTSKDSLTTSIKVPSEPSVESTGTNNAGKQQPQADPASRFKQKLALNLSLKEKIKHENITQEKGWDKETVKLQMGPFMNDTPQPFLEGKFVGGWQSNSDLNDRSKIIYNIVNLFKQTRTETDTEYQK